MLGSCTATLPICADADALEWADGRETSAFVGDGGDVFLTLAAIEIFHRAPRRTSAGSLKPSLILGV
jgi:hypothetical protein